MVMLPFNTSGQVVLACSLAAGAVDTTSERVNTGLSIFGIGVFVLVLHTAVFILRSSRKERRTGWVFWSTLGLSVIIIPIVFILLAMSAGAACGYGASYPPAFLLIFELVGFAVQLVSWRFSNQPAQSPIPQD